MHRSGGWPAAKPIAATFALGATLAAFGQTNINMYLPVITSVTGGIDSRPVITGIVPINATNAQISYTGLEAPYQVQGSADGTNWVVVATNAITWPYYLGTNTVPTGGTNTIFRLAMLNMSYISPSKCVGCHDDKVNAWAQTGHATLVWSDIADTNGIVQSSSLSCLRCHTTGYGQPGGFVTNTTTPQFTNVSCEACHGPAGAHYSAGGTLIYRPVPTDLPELCGTCHNGTRHGDYTEWAVSLHATNYHTSYSCGYCHSGNMHTAMVKNYEDMQVGVTNLLLLPSTFDLTNYGPTCVTCHDPHGTANPSELRNPLWSTNFYTVPSFSLATTNVYNTDVFGNTSTNTYYLNTTFATQYDPTVQICGQCHVDRAGSNWTNSSAVHQATIYPLFIGMLQPGVFNSTNIVGTHGLNTNGCAVCHMASIPYASTNQIAYHGHKFQWQYSGFIGCVTAGCHTENPSYVTNYSVLLNITNSPLLVSASMAAIQLEIETGMSNVVAMLNTWGLTKGSNYVSAAAWNASKQWTWESGSVSSSGLPRMFGPNYSPLTGLAATNYVLIPDAIRQARFELYNILRDRTYGVHNPQYTRWLINDSSNKVNSAISGP
jgi:hypothetical protein